MTVFLFSLFFLTGERERLEIPTKMRDLSNEITYFFKGMSCRDFQQFLTLLRDILFDSA